MRLWSTVVIQLATRPRFQSARYGCTSVLAATREPSFQVAEERVDLRVRPVVANRRHPALSVPDEVLERLPIGERGIAGDLRSVAALPERAVTLCADAGERLLPDGRAARVVPGQELGVRPWADDDDVGLHRRVIQPAELGAL